VSGLFLDTNVVIWYFAAPDKLSNAAREAITTSLLDGHPLYISSVTIVELIYLTERQRIPSIALARLRDALVEPMPSLIVVPIDENIAFAIQQIPRDEVPDMPDRLIAASSLYLGVPLVTSDGKIIASLSFTIW